MDPGKHQSLLLVKHGTLALKVCCLGKRLTVYATRSQPGRGRWTSRAIPADSVEHARQIARRLVRELGP